MTIRHTLSCDLFCAVVDNYGDIGVCWRLARQLVQEHNWRVRLWVDNLKAFSALRPEIDISRRKQIFDGVDVRHWTDTFDAEKHIPNKVVIEAFACELPATYVMAMYAKQQAKSSSIWINLEYLGLEDWVEDYHLQKSIHPQLGLQKTFFFPGFTEKTGGVARENDLITRRNAWFASPNIQSAHWRALGFHSKPEGALTVSLFSYENTKLPALLSQWEKSSQPIICLVPQGCIMPLITGYFGIEALPAGKQASRGALTVHGLPFLPQDRFDQLLWSCDLNFVRGEDSFVRAQWAGKPFVWHIYPQVNNAHRNKLDAFLTRYLSLSLSSSNQDDSLLIHEKLDKTSRETTRTFWYVWNNFSNTSPDWAAFIAQLPALQRHSRAWTNQLMIYDDLTQQLVNFTENNVECEADQSF
ncbi:elongation factor P maturation arginine rhamnosyltransferase EarP [Candidatus Pandoraea novymonadis]|uniref:Protein-arginine rhamnosyltransferase n=1 Tax=Candidatus Pandoraea novymonadis TaxID=1808959 RepID=A0ABX5FD92_9BURK|nr:elongation factor P maturation arginine rhamnosyltransferase EarP [Candidatus Pandoraea novymonadis]PSB91691.1 hypothetical protein BZL35_00912 [Candidatus Pandoraea novymonadis]